MTSALSNFYDESKPPYACRQTWDGILNFGGKKTRWRRGHEDNILLASGVHRRRNRHSDAQKTRPPQLRDTGLEAHRLKVIDLKADTKRTALVVAGNAPAAQSTSGDNNHREDRSRAAQELFLRTYRTASWTMAMCAHRASVR